MNKIKIHSICLKYRLDQVLILAELIADNRLENHKYQILINNKIVYMRWSSTILMLDQEIITVHSKHNLLIQTK